MHPSPVRLSSPWLAFNARGYLLLVAFYLLGVAAVDAGEASTHWPMSGGPDGTWAVVTEATVPLEWSVRKGKNIKWKKPLPAGGQSGIAVWGDRLYLTINPPVERPPLSVLEAAFTGTKAEYDRRFAVASTALEGASDARFLNATAHQRHARAAWVALLATDSGYQEGSERQRRRIAQALRKNNPAGTALGSAEEELLQSVFAKDPELAALKARFESTDREIRSGVSSADIVLLCLDAETGDTLWERTVRGRLSSGYNYGFSDSTTPCPMTDGNFVWVINASGGMACYSKHGDLVWERMWSPSSGRPFNKQFDSILSGDSILSVEPPAAGDTTRREGWNYLHAFDKRDGSLQWTSEDPLTHYNTPVLGKTADGRAAVLIGRGGPHGVPERPVGLSLLGLEAGSEGKTIWRWEPEEDNKISGDGALNTLHWSPEKTAWFLDDTMVSVDTRSGETLAKHAFKEVDQYEFDEEQGRYGKKEGVRLGNTQWQWFCNALVDDKVYFMTRYTPFLVRHDLTTGETVHLEVPREFADDGAFIWKEEQANNGLNARGQRNGTDPRARDQGFQRCFLGTPTLINNYLFLTNAVGMVYVVDVTSQAFGPEALVAVNDLGNRGETWTVNSMSFADGNIYTRTLQEIICIGY